jgi:hypothetical protein
MATNPNNCTEKLTIINQWYSQEIADLITKLKGIPEGTGTLFDSTWIRWVNELGIVGHPAICTGPLSGLTA